MRRYADQGFRSLTKAWLNLSKNPSTGSGGTCYGDSGGPHFLAGTNLVVSITVTGDRFCRASDVTYRLDTAWARDFLAQYVAVPLPVPQSCTSSLATVALSLSMQRDSGLAD